MHWLYRTADCDEDGDPIDFGAVEAETLDLALEHLARRLHALEQTTPLAVRLYPVTASTGVWTTDPPTVHRVTPRR